MPTINHRIPAELQLEVTVPDDVQVQSTVTSHLHFGGDENRRDAGDRARVNLSLPAWFWPVFVLIVAAGIVYMLVMFATGKPSTTDRAAVRIERQFDDPRPGEEVGNTPPTLNNSTGGNGNVPQPTIPTNEPDYEARLKGGN